MKVLHICKNSRWKSLQTVALTIKYDKSKNLQGHDLCVLNPKEMLFYAFLT